MLAGASCKVWPPESFCVDPTATAAVKPPNPGTQPVIGNALATTPPSAPPVATWLPKAYKPVTPSSNELMRSPGSPVIGM